MAVIKHAHASTMAREAVVLDLAELSRHAREIVDGARAQAERIVAAAEQERDALIGTAAQEGIRRGHEEGHAAGFEVGRKQGEAAARAEWSARLSAVVQGWEAALSGFEGSREDMLLGARTDVLALALEIARRVTKRHVSADPGVVAAQTEAVLRLATRASRLTLSVCPEDMAAAREELARLHAALASAKHAELVMDPALSQGSVMLRSERGVIDATIETQLDRIVEALMPGGVRKASAESAGAPRSPGSSGVHEAPRASGEDSGGTPAGADAEGDDR